MAMLDDVLSLLSSPLLLVLFCIVVIFGLFVLYDVVIATPARQIPAARWLLRLLYGARNFLVLTASGAVLVSLLPPIKQPILRTMLQQWLRNVEGGLIGIVILLVAIRLVWPHLRPLLRMAARVIQADRT